MPVKPILMATIRNSCGGGGGNYGGGSSGGTPVNKHRGNIGTGNYNRFAPFLPRQRILSSGKRQLSQDQDDETPFSKAPRLDSNKIFEQLGEQDKYMDAAKLALAAAHAAITAACKPDDGGLGTALHKLGEVCEHLVKGNEALKSTLIDFVKVNPTPDQMIPSINVSRAAGTGSGSGSGPGSGNNTLGPHRLSGRQARRASPSPTPSISPAEQLKQKVKKTLREAERRTVIFDLDLGTAPTINKESISRKVTVALHEKARKGEHDYALNDACEMVDDTLSCSMLEFMGNGTKKFYNKGKKEDPRNGKMCTVPVRLDFKNKETRIQAEYTLRNICKVSCSTPYPKKLRQLLKLQIEEGKKLRDKCFIRNKVDIDNLRIITSARAENGWEHLDIDMEIPVDILGNDWVRDAFDTNTNTDMEVNTQQTAESQVS